MDEEANKELEVDVEPLNIIEQDVKEADLAEHSKMDDDQMIL